MTTIEDSPHVEIIPAGVLKRVYVDVLNTQKNNGPPIIVDVFDEYGEVVAQHTGYHMEWVQNRHIGGPQTVFRYSPDKPHAELARVYIDTVQALRLWTVYVPENLERPIGL